MNPEPKRKYLLITPARNEEENLPDVSESVIGQKVTPALWIIVDDGSTDETPHILEGLKAKYSWIQSIRLPPRPRDITFHYSYVCKQGFDYALDYCRENGIEYAYIGLLDADTVLEENYFGKLMDEFEKDPFLGVASGGVYYDVGGKLSREISDKNLPRGTGRLWRKSCFLETEGYPVEPSPDSISNIKALLRGWHLRQYVDIVEIQKRETSAGEGLWKGYVKNGWMAYYVDKNLPMIMLNTFYRSLKPPYYTGIAYLYGYLNSAIKREKKIRDMEIRDYYRSLNLKLLFSRISGILSRNSTDAQQGEQ
ncbi:MULTISPECIES: glycosyltransferase family 2 protein [unclassified Methanosarcina]|uniref:glycosyltransferase family 2 protein n=1 Tax=unclassified Methanosarcina TaxID=2644672 RepID=UPI0006161BC8|nr:MULTISPECIES: glycosyltransferase family 2 protein [unclassified Methanosarcina]AKB18882.1 glycosyltransferase [Methanosarcina sp. WWM596]AKB23244.1 glycosyltransferase [Methanosarcina sp. WH1]